MPKPVHSSPEIVFEFIEAVESIQPCTIEQVRAKLRSQWPPIRSAKSFCQFFGLIESDKGKIWLSSIGTRILKYTNGKRIEFTKNYWRLQENDPFRYLISQLSKTARCIKFDEVADIIRVKFDPKTSWTKEKKLAIGEDYSKWLQYLGICKIKNNTVSYVGGLVKGFDVLSLAEVEFLKERELFDWFVEDFENPKEILKKPLEILDEIKQEDDDDRRGRLFQKFVAISFKRLGFFPRTKNSPHEKKSRLSFKDNLGGGDVALFFHHPVSTSSHTYLGGSLACEAKSTEGNVGGRAVGQARNLRTKIQERFSDYLVQPIVVSRSNIGYDPSGRNLAPPEVIHLTANGIIRILELQKKRLDRGESLILSTHIFQILDEFVKNEIIEPKPEELVDYLENVVKVPNIKGRLIRR